MSTNKTKHNPPITHKILQINVRGLVSPKNMNQKQKCLYLNKLANSKNADIILLQEWSILRIEFKTNDTEYIDKHNKKHKLHFPIEYFPKYYVHHTGTETAILYNKKLQITPLDIEEDYNNKNRSKNCHFTSIVLHSNHNHIGIHSVYNTPNTDISQFFQYTMLEENNIVGGDFNTHHPYWGSTFTSQYADDFLDELAQTNLQIQNHKNPSYTRIRDNSQTKTNIDLTLISNNIEIENWQILQNEYNQLFTDHIPILTEIKLNSKFGFDNTNKTWNLHSKKWNEYQKQIKHILKTTVFDPDPHKHACKITEIIIKTAENTIGYKFFYHGHKAWWNKKIKILVKKVKRLRRKIQRHKKQINQNGWSQYHHNQINSTKTTLKKWYKRKDHAIKQAKKAYNRKINKYIRENKSFGRKFWKSLETNLRHSHRSIPPLDTPDEKNITHPPKQIKALHNAMTILKQPKYDDKTTAFHNKINNYIKRYINKDPSFDENKFAKNTIFDSIDEVNKSVRFDPNKINKNHKIDNPKINILNDPIKFYEIKMVINNLENYKAIGPDTVHNKMLKKAGIPLIKQLIILFNKILLNGNYPKYWGLTNLLPIPKPNKDHSNPANYRPIALSSCIGKIFEKVIARRLQTYCIKHKIFDNLQCAFQINRCCEDVLTTFVGDIQLSFDYLSDTDVVFTDFSKAYDRVWHEGLIYKLMNVGIHGNMLRLLQTYIMHRFTRVISPNANSNYIHQQIGVPQGSALSPILYIIYTNDYKIHNKNWVKMANFADDTAFWTTPGSPDVMRYQMLQHELNKFTDWCNKWQIVINTDKCSSMNFCNPNHRDNNPKKESEIIFDPKDFNKTMTISKYKINEESIKYKKTARYLGIWFDQNLNFKEHIRRVKNRTNSQYWRLKYLSHQGIELTPHSLSILYKAMARSSIEYGLSQYYPYDTNKTTDKIQNKFLRLITNGKWDSPTKTNEFISYIAPMKLRYEYLSNRNYVRILHTDKYHPLTQSYKKLNFHINVIKHNNYRSPNPNKVDNNLLLNINKNTMRFPKQRLNKQQHNIHILKVPQHKIQKDQITASPTYDIYKFSQNFTVDLKDNDPKIIDDIKILLIFTDGSCIPNPGKGCSAFHIPKQPSHKYESNQYYQFPVPVTITTAEATAISMVLNYIIANKDKQINEIHIFIDNKSILNFLKGLTFPKYNDNKIIINSILLKLTQISHKFPNTMISFHKIKAHSSNPYNNRVDSLARFHAKSVTYNYNLFSKISYQTTLTQLHHHKRKQWNIHWKNTKKSNENMLIHTWNPDLHKKLCNMTKYINCHQLGMITRLITRHIELNHYLHHRIKPDRDIHEPSPVCKSCTTGKQETVAHFISNCPAFKSQRQRLVDKLSKIWDGFAKCDGLPTSLMLFPYNIKLTNGKRLNLVQQMNIWKSLLQFIQESKRFQDSNIRNINLAML